MIEVEQFMENDVGVGNLSGVCVGGEDSLTSGQCINISGSNFLKFQLK